MVNILVRISQEYLVEYENAAEEFKLEGNDIEVFRINSFAGTQITQNQGIRDFPTLIYYRDDETITYRGPLTSTHIQNWVNRENGDIFTYIR